MEDTIYCHRLADYKGFAIFKEAYKGKDSAKEYCYWVYALDDMDGNCFDGLMDSTLAGTKRKIDGGRKERATV
ncbi:MAG: hypothetical protein A4E53_00451 [Pelotomaculum sp. PtaB.Bin104]|nr:MAG: hypothetical protein A4E53_00451 [Pelotomaculum sp. PtaB.Bin104]